MEIRALDPADLDAAMEVRGRSFGNLSGGRVEWWRQMVTRSIDEQRLLAAYVDGRPVATARILELQQWWGGRPLRMAGVGGVVVAPEQRGRGVGTALMTEIVRHAAGLGFSLSVLYPATVAVYRGLGYEFGGAQHKVSIIPSALRSITSDRGAVAALRQLRRDDHEAARTTIADVHSDERASGPIGWSLADWDEQPADPDEWGYLADDGALVYGWGDGGSLVVSSLVAGSEQTARAFWSVVASGSSVAKRVDAYVAPHDPIRWLLRDTGLSTSSDEWWMLRALDPAAALTERGYPVAVEAEVTITVDDAVLAEAAGTWRLSVGGGRAAVERLDGPPTTGSRLDAGGLAALYAGTPTHSVRLAGLLHGGDDRTDAALDAIFAARPYMLDYF